MGNTKKNIRINNQKKNYPKKKIFSKKKKNIKKEKNRPNSINDSYFTI